MQHFGAISLFMYLSTSIMFLIMWYFNNQKVYTIARTFTPAFVVHQIYSIFAALIITIETMQEEHNWYGVCYVFGILSIPVSAIYFLSFLMWYRKTYIIGANK